MEKFLGMQENLSVHGHNIDNLIVWLHWLMIVMFVGWGLFFIYMLIRFRAKANPKADYHGSKSHFSSWIEGVVALIEIVLLVFFSIPYWSDNVVNLPDEKEALSVRVVASQFNWAFHFPGADGKFGKVDVKFVDPLSNPIGIDPNDKAGEDDFYTDREMYLPVNKPIITHITSKDVIHSFGVPKLRVKQDAIPGMEVPIWFTAKKEGDAEIACSQLCGDGHFNMAGLIKIVSAESFEKWSAEKLDKIKNKSSSDDLW